MTSKSQRQAPLGPDRGSASGPAPSPRFQRRECMELSSRSIAGKHPWRAPVSEVLGWRWLLGEDRLVSQSQGSVCHDHD